MIAVAIKMWMLLQPVVGFKILKNRFTHSRTHNRFSHHSIQRQPMLVGPI